MKISLEPWAYEPVKGHFDDAGIDLRTPFDFTLGAGESAIIDTGVHVQIPIGYFGKIESKSGLNIKHNILTGHGVIDSGFRGTIVVRITNNGIETYNFKAGDKICQIVLIPVLLADLEIVDSLDDSISGRDNDGYGSTGR